MDMELGVKLGGVALGLGAGWALKHKTNFDHKAFGLLMNGLLGQAIATVPGLELSFQDGLEIAVGTELTFQAGKSALHAGRSLVKQIKSTLGK